MQTDSKMIYVSLKNQRGRGQIKQLGQLLQAESPRFPVVNWRIQLYLKIDQGLLYETGSNMWTMQFQVSSPRTNHQSYE